MNKIKIMLVLDRKHFIRLFLMLVVVIFTDKSAHAQCLYSPVISLNYLSGECGDKRFQILTGVPLPVYGNNGTLFFASPMTDPVVISSVEDKSIGSLSIYPNPAFDFINIEWPNNQQAEIFIYSQIGQLISKTNIDAFSISTVDIQLLTPGFYTIKAIAKNNQIFINKLIKQ